MSAEDPPSHEPTPIHPNTKTDSFVDRILAKLAASQFLTISVLLHLCLVIASGSFVIYKAVEEQKAMGVPGDMEFLTEGASEVQAPPREEISQAPQLEQVTEAMPAVSEVATPQVQTASLSNSALDSVLTTTNTSTASFSLQSSPASTISRVSSGDIGKTTDSIQRAAAQAGKVGPLTGAASSVEFFGIKQKGRRIAFLLDASESMITVQKGGQANYEKLKQKLVEMINNLEPSTEFNVFVFDSAADRFKPGAVPATGDIKSEFKRWVYPYLRDKPGLIHKNYQTDRLAGYTGKTRMDLALTGAFEMGADVIFVLSDGVPDVRRPKTEKELAEAQEDLEEAKKENAREIEQYKEDWAEYQEKYADLIAQMKEEVQRRRNSLKNRKGERVDHWIEGYKGLPPRPQRPRGARDRVWDQTHFQREELKELLDQMVTELYVPAGIDRPKINIVGYAVTEEDAEWLDDLTDDFRGKYEDFDPDDLDD